MNTINRKTRIARNFDLKFRKILKPGMGTIHLYRRWKIEVVFGAKSEKALTIQLAFFFTDGGSWRS